MFGLPEVLTSLRELLNKIQLSLHAKMYFIFVSLHQYLEQVTITVSLKLQVDTVVQGLPDFDPIFTLFVMNSVCDIRIVIV